MTTVTLDLPETLAEKLREQHITEQDIEAFALAALEIWLENLGRPSEQTATKTRFEESAVPFVRQLIAQNRTLFEMLAQR